MEIHAMEGEEEPIAMDVDGGGRVFLVIGTGAEGAVELRLAGEAPGVAVWKGLHDGEGFGVLGDVVMVEEVDWAPDSKPRFRRVRELIVNRHGRCFVRKRRATVDKEVGAAVGIMACC
ncbi:hypothetical protein TorRG33x02_182150 [Trema orientale]|uniref:Uncharacterized protein n=1 Tax=Trema orientale TaxID=63057 RepID=A0A2P5EKF3_TREOI|nr:hypothetical protein TorRG33x02_182150 [Trema orientale]